MVETTQEQLEVNLPGGIKGRLLGKRLIDSILIIILFVYLAYINYVAAQDHQAIAKELRINTYILSLPQDKRPELAPPTEVYERMKRAKTDLPY